MEALTNENSEKEIKLQEREAEPAEPQRTLTGTFLKTFCYLNEMSMKRSRIRRLLTAAPPPHLTTAAPASWFSLISSSAKGWRTKTDDKQQHRWLPSSLSSSLLFSSLLFSSPLPRASGGALHAILRARPCESCWGCNCQPAQTIMMSASHCASAR